MIEGDIRFVSWLVKSSCDLLLFIDGLLNNPNASAFVRLKQG